MIEKIKRVSNFGIFKDKEEYIYRFINKYSHAQDFDNDSSDNKLDEGSNVIKRYFKSNQTN
jgi:hypothetical protein